MTLKSNNGSAFYTQCKPMRNNLGTQRRRHRKENLGHATLEKRQDQLVSMGSNPKNSLPVVVRLGSGQVRPVQSKEFFTSSSMTWEWACSRSHDHLIHDHSSSNHRGHNRHTSC